MTYPDLPQCRHCGGMLLTEQARAMHESVCSDNPNTQQSTVEDD